MRTVTLILMIAVLAGVRALADEHRDAMADAEPIDEITVYGERELKSLALASPELAEALKKRYVLSQEFEEAKAQRED